MSENTDFGNKRKIECNTNAASPISFKKARYAWQIKGNRRACPEGGVSTSSQQKNGRDKSRNNTSMQESTNARTFIQNNSVDRNPIENHLPVVHRFKHYSCDHISETTHLPKLSTFMHASSHVQNYDLQEDSDVMEPFEAQMTTSVKQLNRARECVDRIWRREEEMGHAIVDNMVNKILEEMGMCPDLETNKDKPTTMAKKFLESCGVDFAIGSQGLNPRLQHLCDENDNFSDIDIEERFTRQNCENGGPIVVKTETQVRNSELEQSDYNCNTYSQMSFNDLGNLPDQRKSRRREEIASRSMETASDNLYSNTSDIPTAIKDSQAITETEKLEYMNLETIEDLAVSAAIFSSGLAIP
ncbi:uncharacterized protein LOC127876203 [Dreissena polymorpha]|uniref:Uncharacterized protein n=1 Tax=Dreissena polymorpha TaxID=45954 RepID=A0A9D4H6Z9_DREPO|nr:uncharacterized protein LOC127876203 [Dreissena polymorpha]KAH3829645.1 hypothetical protein DPMN_102872 [Dreissena polymorpha]